MKSRTLVTTILCAGSLMAGTAVSAGEGWVDISTAEPSCRGPGRYVDCGNGTVTDQRTGLVWLKNTTCIKTANMSGLASFTNWFGATIEVQNLGDGYCGLLDDSRPGDWRMPTFGEWVEMTQAAVVLTCTAPALLNDAGDACFTEPTSSFKNLDYSQDLGLYWSATTKIGTPTNAYLMNLYDGTIAPNALNKRNVFFYVWPVRDAQ